MPDEGTDRPDRPDPAVVAALGLRADGHPRRRRWIVLAVLLTLAAGGIIAALSLRSSGPRWTWTTAPVEQGALTVQVTSVGTLAPLHSVSVSSEVSGTVKRVLVDTNDPVHAGQVLAELDTELLQAQLRQARAQHAAARAGLAQAQVTAAAATTELDRSQRLLQARAISQSQLDQALTSRDQAVAGVDVAQAQLQQAQASLDGAQTNLDRSVITSPIDGVVLARNIDPGQAVVSALQAATLFEVAEDLSSMSVDVEVDEADVSRIHAGQEADFTVAAYADRVFPAHVHKLELAPTANSQVVTYSACLHLDNQEGLLRPGMTATARITAETYQDRVLIPTAALRFSPADQDLAPPAPREGRRVGRVWVLDGEEIRPVEIVTSASDGRRALLDKGELEVGDLLVTAAARGRQVTPP